MRTKNIHNKIHLTATGGYARGLLTLADSTNQNTSFTNVLALHLDTSNELTIDAYKKMETKDLCRIFSEKIGELVKLYEASKALLKSSQNSKDYSQCLPGKLHEEISCLKSPRANTNLVSSKPRNMIKASESKDVKKFLHAISLQCLRKTEECIAEMRSITTVIEERTTEEHTEDRLLAMKTQLKEGEKSFKEMYKNMPLGPSQLLSQDIDNLKKMVTIQIPP